MTVSCMLGRLDVAVALRKAHTIPVSSLLHPPLEQAYCDRTAITQLQARLRDSKSAALATLSGASGTGTASSAAGSDDVSWCTAQAVLREHISAPDSKLHHGEELFQSLHLWVVVGVNVSEPLLVAFAAVILQGLFSDDALPLSLDVIRLERSLTIASLWNESLCQPSVLIAAIDNAVAIRRPGLRAFAVRRCVHVCTDDRPCVHTPTLHCCAPSVTAIGDLGACPCASCGSVDGSR